MADLKSKRKADLPAFSKQVVSQLTASDRSLTDRAMALAESGQGPVFLADASMIVAPQHASHGSHGSHGSW